MSNGTAPTGLYIEFQTAVLRQLPRDLSSDVLKRYVDGQEELRSRLRRALVNEVFHPDFSPILIPLELWARLYRDGLKFKPDAVKPLEKIWQEPKPGYWNVPMLPGLTQNGLVAAMPKLGITVWPYNDDLDASIPHHDRDPNKESFYLVSFRARKEADEEYNNLSAVQLKEQGIKGITNPERLFLGLGFYQATEGEADLNQRHLDVKNYTLCSGSRCSDGKVPSVDWDSGRRRVRVNWVAPGGRGPSIRAREAVSEPL